jgi:hypothetical protein
MDLLGHEMRFLRRLHLDDGGSLITGQLVPDAADVFVEGSEFIMMALVLVVHQFTHRMQVPSDLILLVALSLSKS